MSDEQRGLTADEQREELHRLLHKDPKDGAASQSVDRITLWDHRGRSKSYPAIVAKEILASQVATPRSPKETKFASPPEARPAPESPPVVETAAEMLETAVDAAQDQCPHCEKVFSNPAGLKRHITVMHKDD